MMMLGGGRLASEMDPTDGSMKRAKLDNVDPHNPPPSRVVHVRGVPDNAQSSDLMNAVAPYGVISYIVMMPKHRQALVEMQTLEAAVALVTQSEANPLMMGGRRMYVNYSKSKEINRGVTSMRQNESDATHILLLTVLNPLYPITTDVLHKIASPFGSVQRIVIFRKNGVQAMLEFDNVQSAVRARAGLNGADIYAGCCTLKIEFSRSEKLNVRRNDDDQCDYTNPSLAWGAGHHVMGGPTPGFSQPSMAKDPYSMSAGMPADSHSMRGPSGYAPPMMDPYGMGHGQPPLMDPYSMGSGGAMPGGPSPVLMFYGLEPNRVNCQHLFNLCCLYGNVSKIKLLPNKPGTGMVQFAEPMGAEAAMGNLNHTHLFGQKLEMSHSKHLYIAGAVVKATLPDGTANMVDYSGSPLNRFTRVQTKNRIYKPSKVLHFFNAPLNLSAEAVKERLLHCGAPQPLAVNPFPDRDGAKSALGLVEFATLEEALDCVALCNHMTMPSHNPTGPDYTVKFAFSAAPSANK